MIPKLVDKETLQEAYQSLRRNRRRSIATAFGIFWGIFMLIILISLSQGLATGLNNMTASIAPNTLMLYTNPTAIAYRGFPRGRNWEFKKKDLKRLRERLPASIHLSSYLVEWGTQVSYQDKRTNRPLVGGDEEYYSTQNYQILAGRVLTQADYRTPSKICVLGSQASEILFGTNPQDAIGKYITVRDYTFRVIGVVKAASSNMSIGASINWSVLTSIDIVRLITGEPEDIDNIYVSLPLLGMKESIGADIRQMIFEQHDIHPEDNNALGIFDTAEIFAIFSGLRLGLNLLVWIVAIGTLLTAIIGVSNILIVTIRERTQEFGVRRAMGAKPTDIVRLVMFESLILTTISGLLGLVLGIGLMSLISQIVASIKDSDIPIGDPTISLEMALLVSGIIILSGVLAGLLPIRQAIKIKAIEAIREE